MRRYIKYSVDQMRDLNVSVLVIRPVIVIGRPVMVRVETKTGLFELIWRPILYNHDLEHFHVWTHREDNQ